MRGRRDPLTVDRLGLLKLLIKRHRGDVETSAEDLEAIFRASLPSWEDREHMQEWDLGMGRRCGCSPEEIAALAGLT